MRKVQREDRAGAQGKAESRVSFAASCRGGDCNLSASASGLTVLSMPAVTCDSVFGDCLSDETVQQGAVGNDPLSAAANWGPSSLAQHGWQLCIADLAQATASAGDRPITHMRANPTSLRRTDITTAQSSTDDRRFACDLCHRKL